MGELLCEATDLRSGDKVLDVATGSVNTAISAARRFCEVTGMDLAPTPRTTRPSSYLRTIWGWWP